MPDINKMGVVIFHMYRVLLDFLFKHKRKSNDELNYKNSNFARCNQLISVSVKGNFLFFILCKVCFFSD